MIPLFINFLTGLRIDYLTSVDGVIGKYLYHELKSLLGSIVFQLQNILAVRILTNHLGTVGSTVDSRHSTVVSGTTVYSSLTVYSELILNLLHHVFPSFPGPLTLLLKLINGIGINTCILQDTSIEVNTGTRLGITSVHSINLIAKGEGFCHTVLGNLLGGEVKAVKGSQIIHQVLADCSCHFRINCSDVF